MENIKIAPPIQLHTGICPAGAYTTYIFAQIGLPDGVHCVIMQTAVLRQLAGAWGGKNKYQGAIGGRHGLFWHCC